MICQRGVRLPAPTAPGLKMRPTQRPAAGGGAFIAEGGLAPFTPARPLLALFDADNDQLFRLALFLRTQETAHYLAVLRKVIHHAMAFGTFRQDA